MLTIVFNEGKLAGKLLDLFETKNEPCEGGNTDGGKLSITWIGPKEKTVLNAVRLFNANPEVLEVSLRR